MIVIVIGIVITVMTVIAIGTIVMIVTEGISVMMVFGTTGHLRLLPPRPQLPLPLIQAF
jgi:hypothetical protein